MLSFFKMIRSQTSTPFCLLKICILYLLWFIIYLSIFNPTNAFFDENFKTTNYETFYSSEDENFYLERTKRDLNGINVNDSSINQSVVQYNSSLIKLVYLNDSHEQFTVHWAGKESPVIICLAKNRKFSRRNQSSAVYISYNYGETFEKILVFKLRNGTQAIINTFYISPVLKTYYLFVDIINKCIFITKDYGRNFQRIDLNFSPKTFKLHHTIPNLLLAQSDEGNFTDTTLYLSENFGLSWKKIQEKVKYFSWSIEGVDLTSNLKTIFVQRNEPSGLSTLLSSTDYFTDNKLLKIWLTDIEKVEINGKFIFATRKLKLLGFNSKSFSLQLWISVDRKPFVRALIPSNENPINFYIADVTPETIFLCVTFNDNATHLFTSDSNFDVFTLSLENIVSYNSKISKNIPALNYDFGNNQEFADIHRVAGIRGTYIVSKWKNTVKKSVSEIITLMTFDMGNKWHKLKPPSIDAFGHEVICNLSQNCSLHLVQRYLGINSNIRAILTRESSVGFIMATGVIGTSLKGKQNIYLSVDAGSTWRQILSGSYLVAFGDFGAIIVAVAHYSKAGATNELYYSIDDGETFSVLQFSKDKMRVYGFLNEPGERKAVFTIFGSKEKSHEWIVIQVNFTSLFKYQCKMPEDYKEWSPHDFESDCLLGSTQIFQRRIASHKCFNGEDFIRPSARINCPCKHTDYECDVGFVRDKVINSKCVFNNESSLLTTSYNLFSIPDECSPGKMFNKTKGYRKINGDTCDGGDEELYSPQTLPCPFNLNFNEFILFVQRQEISMISLISEQISKDVLIPKHFLSNAIAADFDIEKHCVFWSDISLNRILKYCLNGRQFHPEILVETDLDSVEGIVYNQINHHLYFVNGNKPKIELIHTDVNYKGRMRRTIISRPNIEKPRGIALDPINCYLFVTDWSSSKPAIIRSELDGENVKVLFNSNIVTWPNGITVDHRAQRILWVDAKHDYIASSDFDGKDFKYIIRGDEAPHPFALGVFKDLIFYDDWNLHKLILINQNNATNRKIILNDVYAAMDLKIITPFFHNKTNICNQNSTCPYLCIPKPFNSYRCLCPDGFVTIRNPDNNEKCACPPGEELTKSGACKPTSWNSSCPSENEFKCDNGNCISRFWKCDEDDDCGDNSDEKSCSNNQCKEGEFQCKSTGNCITNFWICDFEKECDDGSDEDINMCASLYPKCNSSDKFQCNNYRCIDQRNVCDHIDHCRDGSDEINCPYNSTTANTTCDEDHFQCHNGDCIPLLWRCNFNPDCPDKSDELGCDSHHCLSNEFSCPNFICIEKIWVCDEDRDCIDGSDELNCTVENTTVYKDTYPSNSFFGGNCPENWFSCQSGKCIPLEWHCDGNIDCPSGSDEFDCNALENSESTNISKISETKENVCGPTRFFCYKSNSCIFGSYVCDGYLDCNEGEDELNCKYNSRFKCPGAFSCSFSLGCIPLKKVCDGKKDCNDGSDEWDCTNSRIPVNSICLGFTCKYGECIESNLRCDNKIDCFDGSDEENCDEITYAVEDLFVIYESIKLNGFTISWKTPNSSLNFFYMPAYSLYDDEGESVNTTWISSERFTFTNLQPGYTYKVFVYCKLVENKEKIYSPRTFIKVTTESIAPKPPQNFSATNVGLNKVLLKWSPPQIFGEPIKGYKAYYSPPVPPISKMWEFQENQVQLCCFQVGVNYTFWVTSLTKNLESAESNKISLSIGPIATIKELHQKNITNSSVFLEWEAFPNRINKWFIVYRCDDYFPSFVQNVTTVGNQVLIKGLSPGVNYQFKLYPIISDTVWYEGIEDNMISIRTLGPQLPSVIVETTVQGSVVLLSWLPPSRYLSFTNVDWTYAVYIGYNLKDLKLYSETKDNKVVLKNLYSCELYVVQIRVIKPFGIGPAQNEYKIMTKFDPTSPPKGLKFQETNSIKTKYRISWNLSCPKSTEKVGYIVSVNDTVCGCEDRFKFQPNSDFYHSFELSVHYGAVYEIKVSTDHIHARWSEKIILKAPPMPSVPKPFAFIDEKGKIFVFWKTIPNYPKDYQEHSFQYKVFISHTDDVKKGELIQVKEPPAIHKPKTTSSLYYIGVSLIDNHGYEGPVSETYYLYLGKYIKNDFAHSSTLTSTSKMIISLVLLIITSIVIVSYVAFKKIFRYTSPGLPFIISSHYNSRSDSATVSSYVNVTDDEANAYSDDEPLVLA